MKILITIFLKLAKEHRFLSNETHCPPTTTTTSPSNTAYPPKPQTLPTTSTPAARNSQHGHGYAGTAAYAPARGRSGKYPRSAVQPGPGHGPGVARRRRPARDQVPGAGAGRRGPGRRSRWAGRPAGRCASASRRCAGQRRTRPASRPGAAR